MDSFTLMGFVLLSFMLSDGVRGEWNRREGEDEIDRLLRISNKPAIMTIEVTIIFIYRLG